MKNLYFIRHGESKSNRLGQAGGHNDAPLTKLGKEQAKEAAKMLRDSNIKFDIILSSPLKRALDTAHIVAEKNNYQKDNIEVLEELIERTFGDLDGKEWSSRPDITHEKYYQDERIIDKIQNSESLEDLYKRASRFFKYVRSRPEETIVITGHGAFGRALKRVIANDPYYQPMKPIPNAKLIKLI